MTKAMIAPNKPRIVLVHIQRQNDEQPGSRCTYHIAHDARKLAFYRFGPSTLPSQRRTTLPTLGSVSWVSIEIIPERV